ncbi:MAG: DNA-methyltransferase [Candidatus Acidiferrales bacterium]
MPRRRPSVALSRKYAVTEVAQARSIALEWLEATGLDKSVSFGLPEVDDRYHVWRVPLVKRGTKERVGEVVIDARTSLINKQDSTSKDVLEARLLGKDLATEAEANREGRQTLLSWVRDTIVFDDCERALPDFPASSMGLVFTSPPYFNARPEYEDFVSYEDYLSKMRRVIRECNRVLDEGRFFVINVSPVLVRRASRNEASKRIAVPFDLHRIFIEEGFDFIDDIIWVKPEGAGWATGRGRRFAADRNPLQYKPVPVTEYVLVYRKSTDKLIDWNIRNHPDQSAVAASKIADDYERTNIWKLSPAHSELHPAIFPAELAERVVRYYSFVGDVVLDPFAGIGTTGAAAAARGRKFVLIENDEKYINAIRSYAVKWLGKEAERILCVNCAPPDTSQVLPVDKYLRQRVSELDVTQFVKAMAPLIAEEEDEPS